MKINLLKPNSTIVVAMSGGVDSSTVAAILAKEGYRVIGITLQLYDHGQAVGKKGACCAGQDIYDAKMVASILNIPHYVLDYESNFKQAVVDDFVDSYMRGETPLPCVRCNQSVKFNDLLNVAKSLGAEMLVTGHYVRKLQGHKGPELHVGIEAHKDQSYFLFTITKDQLQYLDFPLGELTKEQTREMAHSYGLPVAQKDDSQDICFVPNGDYRSIIEKINPNASKKGKIIHVDGFELGEHNGIMNFTIGQRRGLGIAFHEPLYVIKIDPINQIVYVGAEDKLETQKFAIKEVNWLLEDELHDGLEVQVKIRSTKPAVSAKIYKINSDRLEVKLLAPIKAVTPGQACVIYDQTRVLGGGWITKDIFS